MRHRRRPRIDPDLPLLVTKRVMEDLSLEDAQTWSLIRDAVAESAESMPGFAIENVAREGMEVVLRVTAKNEKALTRGMQGLSIKIARRLNRLHSRSGRVFAERYQTKPAQ